MTLAFFPPFDKQKEFLAARARFVAYGGSRGGGKSYAVRLKASLLALHYPGIRILIMRRTYGELNENHIKIMRKKLHGVALYREYDKSLSFKNHSQIKFGYCDGDADITRYQGQEYDVIFIDEATQFSEFQFSCICASVRGANSFPKRIYLTCNPGGIGHGWVKRLFIDRDFYDGEIPEDYVFIRATVYDNIPLLARDPSYLDTLRSLPPDLRRAWLEGDWDLEAGQFFSEFRRETHVVEPFEIPNSWNIYRAFDYGLDMLACLWAAVDEYGQIFIFRELYEQNLIVSAAAQKILDNTQEYVRETYAPGDIWNRQKDSGKSMYEIFYKEGVPLTRADSNRVQGWMQLKEALSPSYTSIWAGPRLKIFSNCKNLIRCLPLLAHDNKNPSDVATEPHEITHIADALRYFIRSRPATAKLKRIPTEEEKFRADIIRRHSAATRNGRF